ncbi:c-type cytochrome [Paenibacillus hamazuiensis]|uniref:c-type cytochrome n=1 Tax=Paenibacillus hamazuiensis TaxID=2936508 RepID=UPI00200C2A77|nr:cytochrome c [Paenibacillus hamazuiensis]
MKKAMIGGALLLVAALAGGCGNGDAAGKTDKFAQSGPGPYLTDAPQPVQELFKQNCMSCHGTNLEGKVGPKTNLQHVAGKMSKEQIAKQISNGGGGMPSFGTKLKPEDVAALADWLSTKK